MITFIVYRAHEWIDTYIQDSATLCQTHIAVIAKYNESYRFKVSLTFSE